MNTYQRFIQWYSRLPVSLVGINGIVLGMLLTVWHHAGLVPGGWNTVLMGFIGPTLAWMASAWLSAD